MLGLFAIKLRTPPNLVYVIVFKCLESRTLDIGLKILAKFVF